MTKDEALKMAIEFIHKTQFESGGNYYVNRDKTIKACKEALEQPLTRDWKETIDERIAKDDEFKRALEQPSVAELNDEYLRDTHVEGLSSAQDTHPAPSWQGLSDDEREILYDKAIEMPLANLWNDYAYLIEQALKEKNKC